MHPASRLSNQSRICLVVAMVTGPEGEGKARGDLCNSVHTDYRLFRAAHLKSIVYIWNKISSLTRNTHFFFFLLEAVAELVYL